MPPLAWRRLLLWSLAGTVAGLLLLAMNVSSTPALGGLVDTGPGTPAAGVIGAELGPDAVVEGGRHDGAFFYVIAREPMHLDSVSTHLDGPRYRLQRIFYPVAAWLLHPSGGGDGLVRAMLAVGVLGLAGGAVATGALSLTWNGPVWPAAVFPVVMGSILSLRISVPDPLALALALAAIVLVQRGHTVWGVACAVAAVLTREPTLLVFAGMFAWRRDRAHAAMVVAPAAIAAAWGLYLVRTVPAGAHEAAFGPPFSGFQLALDYWRAGIEPIAPLSFLIGVGLGVAALVRWGVRHPVSWVIVIQLAFMVVLTGSVLAPERNMTRQVLPLTIFGMLALVTKPDGVERLRWRG